MFCEIQVPCGAHPGDLQASRVGPRRSTQLPGLPLARSWSKNPGGVVLKVVDRTRGTKGQRRQRLWLRSRLRHRERRPQQQNGRVPVLTETPRPQPGVPFGDSLGWPTAGPVSTSVRRRLSSLSKQIWAFWRQLSIGLLSSLPKSLAGWLKFGNELKAELREGLLVPVVTTREGKARQTACSHRRRCRFKRGSQ